MTVHIWQKNNLFIIYGNTYEDLFHLHPTAIIIAEELKLKTLFPTLGILVSYPGILHYITFVEAHLSSLKLLSNIKVLRIYPLY